MPRDRSSLTYSERAEMASCGLGRHLFNLMSEKETNLCVALDETDPERFMNVAESLGSEIAILKTHVDTIENFDSKLTVELAALAREHHFLIFEDRKFSDIGKTVKNQYTKGAFHLIEWADIVNVQGISGPDIIEGLREDVEDHDLLDKRALLLVAQMSSKGNLINAEYTERVVQMGLKNEDFVMGFIGAGKAKIPALAAQLPPGMLIVSPGVKIGGGQDALGQQYTPPEDLIAAGADIVTVGSDIWSDADPMERAKLYRQTAWDAYQARITAPKVERERKPRKKSRKNATR